MVLNKASNAIDAKKRYLSSCNKALWTQKLVYDVNNAIEWCNKKLNGDACNRDFPTSV